MAPSKPSAGRPKSSSQRIRCRRQHRAASIRNRLPNGISSHPLTWAREYLPDYFSDEPADFHRELMSDLADDTRRLIARVAPRGHAKSTCATLAFPLWCICQRRRRNIVLITHEISLARQFLRDIRTELETNPRILSAYPELAAAERSLTRGPARTCDADDALQVSRPAPLRKRSESVYTTATGLTIQAKSVGASLRGTRVGPQRPDLILCDDIEKDERIESPEGRAKLEHWLRRVVLPALAPDGRLVVLGSLLHYDSLLANLANPRKFPGWNYAVYRALEARPNADGTFSPEALWPARWPVSRLREERARIGTTAFEQEYQANPIDTSRRAFRPEWLSRYDPAALHGRELVSLMAVDPATGVSNGDFFALWIGQLDSESGVLYTRELTLERIGVVDQVRRIVAAWQRWRPVKIGIETVAYQAALQQILEEHSRREGLFMPIVPLRTVANKIARIEGIAPFLENGTFRLPAELDPEIEAQFLQFPRSRHDDAPDVCAMGIELARTLRGSRGGEIATAGKNPYARRGGW